MGSHNNSTIERKSMDNFTHEELELIKKLITATPLSGNFTSLLDPIMQVASIVKKINEELNPKKADVIIEEGKDVG